MKNFLCSRAFISEDGDYSKITFEEFDPYEIREALTSEEAAQQFYFDTLESSFIFESRVFLIAVVPAEPTGEAMIGKPVDGAKVEVFEVERIYRAEKIKEVTLNDKKVELIMIISKSISSFVESAIIHVLCRVFKPFLNDDKIQGLSSCSHSWKRRENGFEVCVKCDRIIKRS